MDFDEIFEEYFDRIYYKVLGVVKNPEDAEDISQSVYRNLKSFRSESNIYTWIYKIAINKIYDFFRKRKIELDINEEILMLEDNTNIDTPIFLEERLKLISLKEREIVILKDIYGYKLKEIAEMKGINISTIKSIYYKAIKDMGGN